MLEQIENTENKPSDTQTISFPEFSTEKVEQVRIFFSAGKPSEKVRDFLKERGCRYQPGNEETLGRGYWYGDAKRLAGTPFVGE